MQDYCEALEFYLRSIPSRYLDRILFVDNSNTDLSPLQRLVESVEHDKRVELISFDGNRYPPEYGKRYGEFKLLDHGLANCGFVADTDVLWKVTGRLRVLNLVKLIESAPAEFLFYCDLRDVPFIGNTFGGNQWMDLRLFACTVEGYDRFMRGRYPELRNHGSFGPEQQGRRAELRPGYGCSSNSL